MCCILVLEAVSSMLQRAMNMSVGEVCLVVEGLVVLTEAALSLSPCDLGITAE
jgi:hypothetical protein